MRHVERRHHRDALGAHYFAGLAGLVHLRVEIGDRLHQRFALVVVAGDAVAAAKQVDFDGLRLCHVARLHPGRRESRPSRRALAPSILSWSRLASPRAAASCWRSSTFSARSRSQSETNCATLVSSELNSVSTRRTLCCKTQATSSSKLAFCMYLMTLPSAPARGPGRVARRRPEGAGYGAGSARLGSRRGAWREARQAPARSARS